MDGNDPILPDRDGSAASWRALAESVPDQIFRLDRSGTILFVNHVVSPLSREDVVGTHWLSWVPEEHRERLDGELLAVLGDGRARTYELEARGPDESVSVYASHLGPVVEGGEIVGAVLCARDVTRQRMLEEQLITSDRLASMGTLAAGLAHEVNNPLACVVLNLALLDKKLQGRGDAEALQIVAEVREAAARVQHVVRDLRAFASGQEEPATPVDPVAVLEATLRLCASETRYKARVETRFEPVPPIAASESRLGQVFLNLIVNAAQSIPAGAVEKHAIRLVVRRHEANQVAIEVTDTGRGIPESERRKLFTPFFTTGSMTEGTGLGLSIVHRIVSGLGGDIRVSSKVGEGSTFTVLLPAAVAAQPALREAEGAEPRSRRPRVLLIDDEPMLRTIIGRALEAAYEVESHGRADEALERVRRGAIFDAIVCDLMMPHMTGMEFHAALSALRPADAERVIFLTGGAFTEDAVTFLGSLRNACLSKPFEIDDLIAAIDERVSWAARSASM